LKNYRRSPRRKAFAIATRKLAPGMREGSHCLGAKGKEAQKSSEVRRGPTGTPSTRKIHLEAAEGGGGVHPPNPPTHKPLRALSEISAGIKKKESSFSSKKGEGESSLLKKKEKKPPESPMQRGEENVKRPKRHSSHFINKGGVHYQQNKHPPAIPSFSRKPKEGVGKEKIFYHT